MHRLSLIAIKENRVDESLIDPDFGVHPYFFFQSESTEGRVNIADVIQDVFLRLACCGDDRTKIFDLKIFVFKGFHVENGRLFFIWQNACCW